MRVLHSLDSLNRGGAEMLELDVCRNAAANGLDLTFVATGGGDLEHDFRGSGAEFLRMQRGLPVDPVLVWRLRRLIRRRRIDVVHSQQAVDMLHLYLAKRGLPVKCVLSFQGLSPGKKNEMALKFLLPRVDARIVVSDDLRESLAREQGIGIGPGEGADFVTLHNGVDFKRLHASEGRGLRGELGLAQGTPLAGTVGNFYPGRPKDQMTVCRALLTVFQCVPASHFVFAGGRSAEAPEVFDECVAFCRAQGISERVHFLGKRADLPDVLAALDVFVLASVREGLPLSVIEAMGMGLPAVLSNIGALREVSGDGKYAVLFRTGDADDLAEKMIALLQNARLRAHLGAEAKVWATSQFSIERHIANLLTLYQRLGA
jgi:L-malate glycosyltransferase